MIRITQLKLPVNHTEEELRKKAAHMLHLDEKELQKLNIFRQSLDARKKPELYYSYTIDLELKKPEQEKNRVRRAKSPQILLYSETSYKFAEYGTGKLSHPPVVVGTGPAGLFCGLMLARHGYCPLILERGWDVDRRLSLVGRFWETGELDPDTNVQFGEGGAGTFSDGKLNTLVKDPAGRNRLVLESFCEFGADPAILYQNKPHIGTDVLSQIVKNIREEIVRLGGSVRFGCQVTDLIVDQNAVKGVVTKQGEQILSETIVLAVGHSARDTFSMLYKKSIPMSAKAFAVGIRIQHPQIMIDHAQYGRERSGRLGAADYKLTWKAACGRGVYSFCMCPGGFVVNASSEPEHLAVNGMSYHDRGGVNANSALIVTVTPDDFPDHTPLGGMNFQKHMEKTAYKIGNGKIPVQLYGDFSAGRDSVCLGEVEPQMKGQWEFAPLSHIFPSVLCDALKEGITGFGNIIPGFDREDAILAGVESRTSSPVRIWRNDGMESEIKGLYPCGEGAGYAGGITSAAMDGIRVAEAIAEKYQPVDTGTGRNKK